MAYELGSSQLADHTIGENRRKGPRPPSWLFPPIPLQPALLFSGPSTAPAEQAAEQAAVCQCRDQCSRQRWRRKRSRKQENCTAIRTEQKCFICSADTSAATDNFVGQPLSARWSAIGLTAAAFLLSPQPQNFTLRSGLYSQPITVTRRSSDQMLFFHTQFFWNRQSKIKRIERIRWTRG